MNRASLLKKVVYEHPEAVPASILYAGTAGTENIIGILTKPNSNDCVIDWDDGTFTTVPSGGGNINHTYAVSRDYNIRISGNSFSGFYYAGVWLVHKNKVKAVYSLGRWPAYTMGKEFWINGLYFSVLEYTFFDCRNLTEVSPDALKYVHPTGMLGTFLDCRALRSIPEDLFRFNREVRSFSLDFSGCTALTSIPANLFAHNTKVTFLSRVFAGSKITTVPSSLFSNMPALKTAEGLFTGCTQLGSVPLDLFANNPALSSVSSLFADCTQLGSVPLDLFSHSAELYNFRRCFYGCTRLVIPADILGTNINRFAEMYPIFVSCFDRTSWVGSVRGTAPALWTFNFKISTVQHYYGFGNETARTRCFAGSGNSTTSLTNFVDIPFIWRS